MTETPDNLPAVRNTPEIVHVDTDSWRDMARPILALAETVAGTEFVPRGLRDSVPKTAAAMLYGREIGLPPLTSLGVLDVIEGKPGLSAEGMRMLTLAAGHELEVMENTGAVAILRGRRRGSDRWHTVTWTIDMARAAGLAGKSVWQKYPRAMLLARATTELCRATFPDVIHGFRGLEELQDMSGDDTPAEGPGEPQAPRTRVARKRAASAARPDTAALEGPRPTDDAPMGPPLPHELNVTVAGNVDADEIRAHVNRLRDSAPGGADDTPGGVSGTTGGGIVGATEPPPVVPTDSGAGSDTPVTLPAPDQTPEGGGESPDLGEGDGATPPPSGPPSGRKRSAAQHRMIMAEWPRLGVDPGDREERLYVTGKLIGRVLESSNDLLHTEASGLIDTLGKLRDRDALDAHLDTLTETENGDTLL